MNYACILVALAVTGSIGRAASRASDENAPVAREGPQWVFSALPKAFDPNPHVVYNVITEMTPAGKKVPKPTAQKPAYFELAPGGHLRLGMGATYNDKGPPVEEMQRILTDSLGRSHYVPAAPPAQPPSLLIIFHWGSHSAGSDGDEGGDTAGSEVTEESESTASSPVPAAPRKATPREVNEFIERARLVGGERFAQDLIQALVERSTTNETAIQPRQRPVPQGMTAIPNIMGDLGGLFSMDSTNPMEAFRRRHKNNEGLLEDAKGTIYFVLASAYDYASVARSERVLLWRTKMTINADGISMSESLLPLIANAGPYFGRDMRAAEAIGRRLDREGSVEVGAPTVVEVIEEPAAAAPVNDAPVTP